MTTSILIQARLNSSRFPKKVFHKIKNKSVLEHSIQECQKVKSAETSLLVPHNEKGVFYKFLNRPQNLAIIGGSESDVLNRFYRGAVLLNAKTIVRITADCPCLTASIIENTINFYNKNDYDYVSNFAIKNATNENDKNNHNSETLISDGFSCEVFSFDALQKAHSNIVGNSKQDLYDLEHVSTWIKRNLKCGLYNKDFFYIKGKFSLDEQKDLKNINLYLRLWEKGFIQVRSKKEILSNLNQGFKN